jgi:hypothetical protein
MTIRLNPRWLLVSALLFSLQFCRAQIVVPPTLSFDLGTSNSPESALWDLNGSYVVDLQVAAKNGLAVNVEIAFSLIQSPSGSLSTTTNELSNVSVVLNAADTNASPFAAVGKITGKVTGVGGIARAHFTVRFVGAGSLGGQNTDINGSLTVDAETDPSTGQLVGTKLSSFSASFPGLNSIKGKADFATGLPSDGTWNLTLNMVGINKITGSGIIATPLQSLGLDLSGKFKNGLFVIKANGGTDVPNTVSGVGSSGTILLPDTFDTIQFNGKLLGQKLSFNVSPTTPE